MWFYDDILIRALRHAAGTVIKNIPTPRGVVQGRRKNTGRTDQQSQSVGLDVREDMFLETTSCCS